ncbi:FAD-dependent monooxygenase [Filomicrobium sp.]|uniref:FAD-dependent monooxygenase n=1 Tax=Filomicrobium sp. TaxID=2024831 RepID=UPI0025901B6C|nr:FAD-dependent monooxygenase [Filomicrobium sp.]MCV0371431.1 FAD-dependent monooxygenase [Filomicrobium sp.]
MRNSSDYDAIIVGAGPTGLAAALAVAQSDLRVALIAAPHNPAAAGADTRTAALFKNSLTLLSNIGAWTACEPASAPLNAIRLIDDTGALLRAPEVVFQASEIGHDLFGYNVPQQALVAALRQAAAGFGHGLTVIESAGAQDIAVDADRASLTLAEGQTLTTQLIIGADGRRSICRHAAGIATASHTYNQAALACTFKHAVPHHGISTEFHRRAGPMTTVPMPGRASSLIWVEHPDVAHRLASISAADFLHTLEDNLQGLLGKLSDLGPRVVFPLSMMSSESMGRKRIALVGEAAHVAPPIGAQGLNLSFRDIATLADILRTAKLEKQDLGGDDLLRRYDNARHGDVNSRARAVDLLNYSLTSQLIPVQLLRGAGVHALKALSPLRRRIMAAGLAPAGDPPPLMREADTRDATFASRRTTL